MVSFLEGLTRRPQRLIVLATICLLVLSFTTWLSFSPTGSETIKDSWGRLPTLNRPWANSNLNSNPSTNLAASPSSPSSNSTSNSPPKSISDAYAFNPGNPNSLEELTKWAQKGDDGNLYPPNFVPHLANKGPRARAGFIVLVRNGELASMRDSMQNVEDRFNRKYNYPWIFLNNEEFSEEFKKGVRQMTRAECRFGLVPKEHWGYPEWISQDKAAETRVKMKNIIYGDNESYRHMCRFQSGFFFRHPLTLDLEYYWRVEPGIKLYCDVDYDPFLFMQMNNKTYGFTMALHEYIETIPTLWSTSKQFVKQNPQYVAEDNGIHFMTDEPERFMDPGYNLCHFWSNFEIGDLRFWRSKAYMDYFDHLDKAGGFFYERWGDAPVHSIAAILFLDKSRLHHFNDIGYFHNPWGHCPTESKFHDTGRCNCDPEKSFTNEGYSCIPQWYKTLNDPPRVWHNNL